MYACWRSRSTALFFFHHDQAIVSRPWPAQQPCLTLRLCLSSEPQSESHARPRCSPEYYDKDIYRLISLVARPTVIFQLLCPCPSDEAAQRLKHTDAHLPSSEAAQRASTPPIVGMNLLLSTLRLYTLQCLICSKQCTNIAPSYRPQPDPRKKGSAKRHQSISPHLSHSTRHPLCLKSFASNPLPCNKATRAVTKPARLHI